MGGSQSQISGIGTNKGEGYRIIDVRENSPLHGQVDLFFDFIIDAIPSKQPEKSTKQILNRLTDDKTRSTRPVKKLLAVLAENEDSVVSLKIVSTKYRNARTIEMVPSRNWGDGSDLAGFQTRLEKYDEVFDTYVPFSDIRPQSPANKAGIQEGEFLIGCREFKYESINQLLENAYERYFDKQYEDKNINLAVYNLDQDRLRVVSVLLARNWGEKGLLGCQFVEGQLSKFPKNLLQTRQALLERKKKSDDLLKVKRQLSETNGASSELLQSLKIHKNRKKKSTVHLKNLLLIEPQPQLNAAQKQQQSTQFVSMQKYRQLQSRVATLEQVLGHIRAYIQKQSEQQQP